MYSIGLDVSKSTIAVYIPINGQHLEIENTPKALKGLYAKLKKLYAKAIERVVFVYEPTGSYSVLLSKFCHDKGIRAFIINPKQSRNYAKALGRRNKNDKVDAGVLSSAIAIADEGSVTVPAINAVAEEIKELMSYYRFTVKARVKASNHLEAVSSKVGSRYVIKDLEKRIAEYRKQEKAILEKVLELIAKDAELQRQFDNIRSIIGIGNVAAAALLHLFLRYPNASRAQIVSLAGIEPVQSCSGSSVRSRPKISKAGDKLYRGALFMSVMVAVRHNPQMRAFYERLKTNGKHTTAAQIAVMRKLLLIAHSLYKNDQRYDPDRYLKHASSAEKEAA